MKKITLSIIYVFAAFVAFAQDDLIKKIEANKGENTKLVFTDVINLERTSVKNQGSSGTCWSYSTNSFLESEILRTKKKNIDISDIYSVRCAYIEKAENYVRLHGNLLWGDGGAAHDVINMYAKYGALPQEVYTGLNYGTTKNQFGEMQAVLEGMLKGVVANKNGKLTPNWKPAFQKVLDTYLGEVPTEFMYEGKKYTPQTFAKDVVGVNPKDYVEISSFTHVPYYTKSVLMVPDNWSFDQVYNVQLTELTDIIDNALKNGYTVAWGTDVSEKYFSWKNGYAYVPEKDFADMTEEEKKSMFDGPKPERKITSEMRQIAYDNYETEDDHGMHIVGTGKDQTGKEYYIVKNSWGDANDYKGYLYVSKAFVQYKTTVIMLHKGGIPSAISKKLGL
jgi:bleomycin hydrolase